MYSTVVSNLYTSCKLQSKYSEEDQSFFFLFFGEYKTKSKEHLYDVTSQKEKQKIRKHQLVFRVIN